MLTVLGTAGVVGVVASVPTVQPNGNPFLLCFCIFSANDFSKTLTVLQATVSTGVVDSVPTVQPNGISFLPCFCIFFTTDFSKMLTVLQARVGTLPRTPMTPAVSNTVNILIFHKNMLTTKH